MAIAKDIVLIGKTGMGKSTVGNILLGLSADGSSKLTPSDEIKPCQHNGLLNEGSCHFEASSKLDSCTQKLQALVNYRLKIRVTDVPGFSDSTRRADASVYQTNLQFVRDISRLNDAFRFDYVLYFLPFREPPERAEGCFREELEVLYFYFGQSIFEHMIMITTNHKKHQIPIPSPEDLEKLEDLIEHTLGEATEQKYTKCPKVLYVPINVTHNEMLSNILEFPLPASAITPMVTACIKCGNLCYDDMVCDREGNKMRLNDSKCHPAFIPKYTKLQRIVNTAIYVIPYAGVYLLLKAFKKERMLPLWTGLGNNEEKCINCECAPGTMQGCFTVGKSGKTPQDIPFPTVQHSCETEKIDTAET